MRTGRTDRPCRPIHRRRRDGGRTRWAQGQRQRVAGAVGAFLDGPLPVRIRAWDGSEAGAAPGPGVPTVVLRSRRALRRLLWEPGEMGLAHAYVSGDLDVDGDLAEGLSAMWALVNSGTITKRRPGARELPGLAAQAVRLGLLGTRPAPPARGHQDQGAAAQQAPRPGRDRAPLRRRQRVLRPAARRLDGLLVGLLDVGGQHPRAGAARQARPDLPQARPRARAPAARHRLRLGLARRARRARVRRPGAGRDDLARAARPGQRPHPRRGPRRAGAGRPARLPRHRREDHRGRRPVRRRQRDRDGRARRRRALPGLRRDPPRRAPAGRAGARPADVARGERTRWRCVHRDLRDPGHGHAPGRRHPDASCSARASRSATCTSCASTTSRRSGPGSPRSRSASTRPSSSSASAAPGCGGSTSPGPRWRSRRTAWASTRILLARPTDRGRSGMPATRDDWSVRARSDAGTPAIVSPAFDLAAFGLLLAAAVAGVVVVFAATLVVARAGRAAQRRRRDVGPGLRGRRRDASYVTSGVLGVGDTVVRTVVLALVAVWGLRLAIYIGWRNHGKGEDPRYAEMLGDDHPPGAVTALRAAQGLPAAGRRHARRLAAGAGGDGAGLDGAAARDRRRAAVAGRVRLRVGRRRPARVVQGGPGRTRARSWTRGSGATPATRTTSATPASGGASSSWPRATRSPW